jgi:hypothetical protein
MTMLHNYRPPFPPITPEFNQLPMAHPFFDAIAFPFALPAAKNLEDTLVLTYQTSSAISAVYGRFALGLDPLSNLAPRLIWKEALTTLTKLSLLKKLCELVSEEFPKNPAISAAIKAVVEAPDPREQVYASGGYLVLDRRAFRDELKKFESLESPVRVLLVSGDEKSGKSHGRHLFFRMAKSHGAKQVYIAKPIVNTLEEAIKQIASSLGQPLVLPEITTTRVAWYQQICRDIMMCVEQADLKAWIAVDNLGLAADQQPLLDPEIKQFFDEFAAFMITPQFQDRFRLLLLHYPEDGVPTGWEDEFWRADRISSSDLTLDHVKEALREGFKAKGLQILEDVIVAEADRVISLADALPARERLKRINKELTYKLESATNTNP